MHINKRIICIDPGLKRIGIAISDESGTIAIPFKVIDHISREMDAGKIVKIAKELCAETIIMGLALSETGGDTASSRRARNLAEEIIRQSGLPVKYWDESLSSMDAVEIRRELGSGIKSKSKQIDHLAASLILQSYLEDTKIRGEN